MDKDDYIMWSVMTFIAGVLVTIIIASCFVAAINDDWKRKIADNPALISAIKSSVLIERKINELSK